MFGSRALRNRLDRIRARVDGPVIRTSSPTVGEAVDRLASSVERHLADHAAETAAASRLTRAFDLIPQGIVLADVTGTIAFRNRAASGFVDARHGEALVEQAIGEMLAAAGLGKRGTRTIDLFGPPRRAIELRAGPLRVDDEAGEPTVVGAFLILDDVSERQRLDAVRRDFVANISHELKTPIGALGVLAETIVAEDDPAVTARLAERMQQEAFRVASTIDDLMQLSRIESDEPTDLELVAVAEVVDGAVDRTRAAAAMAEVDVLVEPVDPSLFVIGDRAQLVSAVANLCDNAVKYTDAGGEVRVSATRDYTGWVSIVVSDTGVGIPARDLERIFERFYRVDRARSRETGGTGLGLSIVRHVVANHHGEITVRSREGEGSTFTFRVPLVSPEPIDVDRP
ncbi:MAG: ATP-binding protein [Acidimicrobiales bacterium]|nr:ATP-binding protein [Acidimicrobiales bacterium]